MVDDRAFSNEDETRFRVVFSFLSNLTAELHATPRDCHFESHECMKIVSDLSDAASRPFSRIDESTTGYLSCFLVLSDGRLYQSQITSDISSCFVLPIMRLSSSTRQSRNARSRYGIPEEQN